MDRCVVTGAAGFVGSSIVDRLLADGAQVLGIDCFLDYYPREQKLKNLASALANPNFQLLEANLLDLDLAQILEGTRWVFHQAAQAGVRASWGEYFQTYADNNVRATQFLLESIKRLKTPVEKVVYASSSSIYGNAETQPTHESVVPAPVSPYGVTKLAAEHLMSLYASEFGVPTVSLRYFTVFGPRQRPDMSFHRLIRTGLTGEEFVLFGDGTQSRDFTFIADIVQANLLAASKGPAGSVFNIGGGSQVSMNHVIELLESKLGKLNIKRVERQHGDARHTSADNSSAKKLIGYQPQVTLEQGLEREIEWLRSLLAS